MNLKLGRSALVRGRWRRARPVGSDVLAKACKPSVAANRLQHECDCQISFSPFTASQGGPLARPPLAIPRGTRLRGPSGSLRCSIYRGVIKLVAALLRQPMTLFPDKSALLARVNGMNPGAHSTMRAFGKSLWICTTVHLLCLIGKSTKNRITAVFCWLGQLRSYCPVLIRFQARVRTRSAARGSGLRVNRRACTSAGG